jgi:hypothetical protein
MKRVRVKGYTKSDGTRVAAHWRDVANDKINTLPAGKLFDDAKSISGVFKKSERQWSDVVYNFEQNQKSAKQTFASIKDIQITQPNIQSNKAKKLIDSRVKTPIVNAVKYKNGDIVIFDGHHRLIAKWAKGNKTIRLNMVKINQ